MKLTTEQLDLISKEIIEGGIKYQDLYEELLDHYILAIEERMSQRLTFGEAFGEVHSDFVNYKRPLRVWDHYNVWHHDGSGKPEYGLGKLQAEYEESLSGEITKRHWQIMKDYFRWPTIVTTLLVGLLTFQFAYLVPREYFQWFFSACVFAPVLIVLPQTIQGIKQYFSKKRKFLNSLKSTAIISRISFVMVLGYWTVRLPSFLNDYNILKEGPLSLIAAITCFYIAYSLSFYQLYRERFKVTMT